MAIEVTVKKWGNSMGIVLPKELVKEKNLKENEKVVVEIVQEADLSDIFGTLKTTETAQEFKDRVRKGWD